MKPISFLLLSLFLLGFSGCGSSRVATTRLVASNQKYEYEPQAKQSQSQAPSLGKDGSLSTSQVSFKDADAATQSAQAMERKIIRNATLAVEVNSPTDSLQKIVSIAETHQGFVVTSEDSQQTSGDEAKPSTTVTLVVRVPAVQFNQTMEAIRAVGSRLVQEKITGQDVTEEFVDLEARIKNQKALELQFLEIMKRAGKVDEALNVQRELANVRTEIERLEGRRRFLENQTSLSTITVTLQTPVQIVNTSGFWYRVRSAFSDGVDIAASIVLVGIQLLVGLLPLLFLLLPVTLLVRFWMNRRRRSRTKVTEAQAIG